MILHQYKIVFGGSMGAGKSAAIKALSDIPVVETEAINTDINRHSKYSTTVGIDYGEIVLEDDTKIGLYGTPGQDRFDFMWSIVCKGAIGVSILIDHSCANRLQDLQCGRQQHRRFRCVNVMHPAKQEQNRSLMPVQFHFC